jgi:lipooligosaccharide transport system permease protein
MTMWPTVGALRVWRRNLESWKQYAPSFFVAQLGEPIFYLLAIGYGVGRYVSEMGGLPYAVFLAPGIVSTTAMNTASFESTFGSFTRMTQQNTYVAILATPCSVADIVVGDILWAATKSVIGVCFVLAVMMLFGLLASPWALALVPFGFLIGLMFACLGLVATAHAPSYDFFNYYFTLFISVMFLFSGVFFPLANLPSWAQTLAWFLPLTHAVNVARALVAGTPTPRLLVDVAWMMTISIVAYVVAERLVRRRLLV